jgi:hypothetical protein
MAAVAAVLTVEAAVTAAATTNSATTNSHFGTHPQEARTNSGPFLFFATPPVGAQPAAPQLARSTKSCHPSPFSSSSDPKFQLTAAPPPLATLPITSCSNTEAPLSGISRFDIRNLRDSSACSIVVILWISTASGSSA